MRLSEQMKNSTRCVNPQPTPNGYLRRCQFKNPNVCPGCHRLHRRHTMMLIGSGLPKKCGSPELRTLLEPDCSQVVYFVTLTAPSFGKIHRKASSNKTGNQAVKCPCGQYHSPEDEVLFTPIKPRHYEYQNQVKWNSASAELWRQTQQQLQNHIPGVAVCAVREWQKRGSIHIHALVRVSSRLNQDEVLEQIKAMKYQTVEVRGETYGWGRQFDVKRVNDASGNVSYMAKVVGYTAKNVGWTESYDRMSEPRRKFYRSLERASQKIQCARKNCEPETCNSKAHRNLGYGGYQLTKTDNWSDVTMSSLREEMRLYAEQKAIEEGKNLDKSRGEYLLEELNMSAEIATQEMREHLQDRAHKVSQSYLNALADELDNW